MDVDIREVVLQYSDILYRVCIVYLCNEQDAQDAIQDTFIRYLEKSPDFQSEPQRKAWLIKVASNICKDILRFRRRHPSVPVEELEDRFTEEETGETLQELLALPVKYKTILYLHYVEGYQIREVAKILGITEGAVKMRLKRGREQLLLALGQEKRIERE